MDFGLSDTQSLLRESIRDFLRQRASIERVREVMESDSGHDSDLLAGLGKLGVPGILVSDEHGGTGLGLLDSVVAAQELGRVTPVSLHSGWVMAPLLLAAAGSEEQPRQWLPRIAAGKALVSLVRQAPSAEDGRLNGSAAMIPDAQVADAFLVAVGKGSGQSLHLLPRENPRPPDRGPGHRRRDPPRRLDHL